MICLDCNNQKNFIVFKGEVIYIKNGGTSHVDKAQTRAMCNECFSCNVLVEAVEPSIKEAA